MFYVCKHLILGQESVEWELKLDYLSPVSLFQSQAPLPSVQLAVMVLQDLLQYSSQIPELAREIGLNSILGILTSLLSLKAEVCLVTLLVFFLHVCVMKHSDSLVFADNIHCLLKSRFKMAVSNCKDKVLQICWLNI